MRCSFHPEIESTGNCLNCGKSICRDCQTMIDGKSCCKDCLADVLSSRGKIHSSYSGFNQKQNWFERHLNWTLVLGEFGIFFAVFIIALLFYEISLLMHLPPIVVRIVLWILYIVIPLFHLAWYLRKKKRSLFWMILWFLPIGWIVILCLTNKSEGKYNEQSEKEMIEHEKQTQETIEKSLETIRGKYPNIF